MFQVWFWSALLAIVTGVGLKFLFDRYLVSTGASITLLEFGIVIAVLLAVIFPFANHLGFDIAQSHKLHYKEFWGGYEQSVEKNVQGCSRDSGCTYWYQCDRYETEEYDAASKTYTTEVHYHHCPYVTEEITYWINTTIGRFNVPRVWLDANPIEYRGGNGIPDAPRGTPPIWLAAQRRLNAGDPGPVTGVHIYDNYVLASTQTILHESSDAITAYLSAHELPSPVVNVNNPIYDLYFARKFQTVGLTVDTNQWNAALNRFNAAFGSIRQGDLHVVAVDATKISGQDAQRYTNAVNAYWQSPLFGQRTLSKNGVGIVLGVTAGKVVWARGFTGMPTGNSGLEVEIRTLGGQQFDPTVLFGHLIGDIHAGKKTSVTTTGSDGQIGHILIDGPNRFVRVHMADYKYLKSEISPSSAQKWFIVLLSYLITLAAWGLALLVGVIIPDHHKAKIPNVTFRRRSVF